ncbi:MAG: PQQ-binding-like beta-propeller repeat protein [Spirillospora sp.]
MGLAGAAVAGGAVTWPSVGEEEHATLAPVAGDPAMWTADAESADEEFFGPVTPGGLLLVEQPLTARGRTRALSRLDAVTGNRVWSVSIEPPLGRLRKVLVADSVVLVRTEEALQAFDLRTGRPAWRRDRKTPGGSSATVLAGAGLVLDSGQSRPEAELDPPYTTHAYETAGGRLRWTTEIQPAVWTQSSSIHAAGLLLGAATSGASSARSAMSLPFSYAVDAATGRQRWWRSLSKDEEVSKMTLAYATHGTVLVSLDGRVLIAQDARTGTIRWHSRFGARKGRAATGADIPVAAGDTVHLCCADGVLRAFDLRDGRRRWEFALGEGPSAMRGVPARPRPIVGNGLVYVTTESTLHVLDAADGRRRWSRPAYESHGGPVMVRGHLFLADGESVIGYGPSDGNVRLRLDLKALGLDGRSIELTTDGVRLYVLARDQVLALSLAG